MQPRFTCQTAGAEVMPARVKRSRNCAYCRPRAQLLELFRVGFRRAECRLYVQHRNTFPPAYVKTLPGKPDIVFRRKRVAVFIDSDFWHGHPERCRMPASNTDYWQAKIARNRARDLAVTAEMTARGWTVLRLWEWDIKHDLPAEMARILSAIGREAATS